jgi:hypothetical protein
MNLDFCGLAVSLLGTLSALSEIPVRIPNRAARVSKRFFFTAS